MSSLIALALLALNPAQAEQGQLTVGAGAGWWPGASLTGSVDSTWTIVPRIGFGATNWMVVEADLGYARGLSRNLEPIATAFTPRLNLVFNPLYEAQVRPTVAVGGGMLAIRVDPDASALAYTGQTIDVTSSNLTVLNFGPGLELPVADQLTFRGDLRYAYRLGEETDADVLGDWEFTVGATYWFGGKKDTDMDGILDKEDACIYEREDVDEFEDMDGCPDPDNDGDSVLDEVDSCDNEPEDMDGWEDEDGCPDPDNDNDSLADAEDSCPNVAGPSETAGCPDKDGDLVPDGRDKCPARPAWQGDAPPEKFDAATHDGCPPRKVKLSGNRIEILDKVFFETGSDVIKEESFQLLIDVADTLKENPQLQLVEVQGHTDSDGSASANRKLSQSRAESVVAFLVEKGVEAERLQAKGHGEDKPIASNNTDEGKAENRRVEFHILKQGPKRPAKEAEAEENEANQDAERRSE